jgi:hypothetical protein
MPPTTALSLLVPFPLSLTLSCLWEQSSQAAGTESCQPTHPDHPPPTANDLYKSLPYPSAGPNNHRRRRTPREGVDCGPELSNSDSNRAKGESAAEGRLRTHGAMDCCFFGASAPQRAVALAFFLRSWPFSVALGIVRRDRGWMDR